MRTALRSRRAVWLLLGIAIIGGLAVAGEIRGDQAGAQSPDPPLVQTNALPEGRSLVGWVGLPTTSTAIIGANAAIDLIWWLDPADDTWILDARALPAALRTAIPFGRGDGVLAGTSRAT